MGVGVGVARHHHRCSLACWQHLDGNCHVVWWLLHGCVGRAGPHGCGNDGLWLWLWVGESRRCKTVLHRRLDVLRLDVRRAGHSGIGLHHDDVGRLLCVCMG